MSERQSAPWQFAIPPGWKRLRLKYVASLKGRLGWQNLRAEEYTDEGPFLVTSEHFLNDRIRWDICHHVTQERYDLDPEIQLTQADLLMMKDGAAMGKLAYVDNLPGPACLNSHLLLFRPKKTVFLNRFLYYLLGSPYFQSFMIQERTGTTFFGISQESIGEFPYTIPPLSAQQTIVDFLDRKTTQIDTLIAKKQRQIELLNEKRQALISQAVTKGIDPTIPMKDTGIPWLGTIPANWDVVPLRFLLQQSPKNGISPVPASEGEGVPSFSIAALRHGKVIVGPHLKYVALATNDSEAYRIVTGDILVMRGNANLDLVGTCGMVVPGYPSGCTYPDILIRIKPNRRIIPDLLVFALNSRYCRWQIESKAKTSNGTYKISGEDLTELRLVVPPKEEQSNICKILSEKVTQVEFLAKKNQDQIDKLREYRQTLISAAVTGRFDLQAQEGGET